MPKHFRQSPRWAKKKASGDRIPHSDKVDRDDPARADILILLHRMELAEIEIDERAVEIATKLMHWQLAEALAREPVEEGDVPRWKKTRSETRGPDWIYYVRCGYLIKIGTTTDLAQRFTSIRPNEVLALEPGGQQLETEHHREFKALRAGGEYFHPGVALQEHILRLREAHGIPQWTAAVVPDGQNFF
ncbi:hypothetical protein ACWENO_13820 [Streptomyces sp. NPDC004436]